MEFNRERSKIRALLFSLLLVTTPFTQGLANCETARLLSIYKKHGILFQWQSVATEIKLANLGDLNLKPLKENSQGFFTLPSFFSSVNATTLDNVVLLGLNPTKGYNILNAFHYAFGWKPYFEYEGEISTADRDIFLPWLSRRKKTVLFFVPRDLRDFRSPTKNTWNEFKWYVETPEEAANVYFIFGAYDLVLSPPSFEYGTPSRLVDFLRSLAEVYRLR